MALQENDPRKCFEIPQCSEFYRQSRNDWPAEVIEAVVNFLAEKKNKPFSLAVDIGCGTGQSSRPLAPYFDQVIGIDISEVQLENARKDTNVSNITYRYGCAEKMPLSDQSVDVITCARSVPWFNYDQFLKEADRVLKPGGCIALLAENSSSDHHHRIVVPDKAKDRHLNKLRKEFHRGTSPGSLGSVSQKPHRNRYANITFPYDETRRMDNFMTHKQTLSVVKYLGIYKSFPTYWQYLQKFPNLPDPADGFQKTVMDILNVDTSPEDTYLTVTEELLIILARKPM